jgi:hypothetical protein
MQATIEFPDAVLKELEFLASQEGATASDLILRLVDAHLHSRHAAVTARGDVGFPLIPLSETGAISPITGAALDELFSNHHP